MFSKENVSSVSVSIDGKKVGDATHQQGALYTVAWAADKYTRGVHVIRATVQVSVVIAHACMYGSFLLLHCFFSME